MRTSTYDRLEQAKKDLRNDKFAEIKATASKIKPIDDHSYIEQEAYKSAREVAKEIGTDKVFRATIDWSVTYNWSDGTEYDNGRYWVFLFALDAEDAKSRLELFLRHSGSSIVDIVEVSREQALAEIKKHFEDGHYPHGATADVCDHILALPTPKMYDEMKKSVEWANNILKKWKDQEEASKRAAWLLTDEGKAWLAKYEADVKLVEELLKKYDELVTRAAEKSRQKEQQEQENEEDVLAVLSGKSEKYPLYKDGICPVIVEGGRKFKGKGFAISWEDRSGDDTWVPTYNSNGSIAHDYNYYHRDDEWTNAIIYDPSSGKIQKANIKYCKVDTSVSNEQCVQAFKKYCEDKVLSTIDWCRSKDPRKSDFEIRNWAKNIIKKYHPYVDVDKYIKFDKAELDNAAASKVGSTVDWAIGLGKGQTETERIIMRALSKKGIDYKDHEAVISMKLMLKFGKNPKVMTFEK